MTTLKPEKLFRQEIQQRTSAILAAAEPSPRGYQPRRRAAASLRREAEAGERNWNGHARTAGRSMADGFRPAKPFLGSAPHSQHHSKAVVGVRVRWFVPVAVGATRVAGFVVERPAPQHPQSRRSRPAPLRPPTPAPHLHDSAVHAPTPRFHVSAARAPTVNFHVSAARAHGHHCANYRPDLPLLIST